jgi:hypothetical protein
MCTFSIVMTTPWWIENIPSAPYSQERELMNEGQQPEDIDNEHDENSENNWCHKHPEEEGNNEDEDSRGSDEYDSFRKEAAAGGR